MQFRSSYPDSSCSPLGERRSKFYFKCDPTIEEDIKVTGFNEDPYCLFNFNISSKYACFVKNSSLTFPPTQTPAQTQTQTPTPTPTPTSTPIPKVKCQFSGALYIESSQEISCKINSGSTCITNYNNGICSTVSEQVECLSSESIKCIGSLIECQTSGVSCSINQDTSPNLFVNGEKYSSNLYESNTEPSSSEIIIPNLLLISSLILLFIFYF